jgi:hypothetical protein
MDSAVQQWWGPKGTVNGRLLDAQKPIRCTHLHALGHIVLRHGRRVVATQRASPLAWVFWAEIMG